MIPLRDDVPARSYPIVNVLLIGLNVVAFVFELSLGPEIERFLYSAALVPAHFTAGGQGLMPLEARAWLPVLVSMFLHGGLGHLAGNMLFLWVFGDNVEDRMGAVRYVLFYVACGAIAALTHIAVDPTSAIPMVGASGAIAGVLGAYMILYPRARVLTFVPIVIIPWFIHVPAVVFLGLWFIGQLLSGGMYLHATEETRGGVAVMAHVGGFVAGVVLCLLLRRPERPLPPRRRWIHE